MAEVTGIKVFPAGFGDGNGEFGGDWGSFGSIPWSRLKRRTRRTRRWSQLDEGWSGSTVPWRGRCGRLTGVSRFREEEERRGKRGEEMAREREWLALCFLRGVDSMGIKGGEQVRRIFFPGDNLLRTGKPALLIPRIGDEIDGGGAKEGAGREATGGEKLRAHQGEGRIRAEAKCETIKRQQKELNGLRKFMETTEHHWDLLAENILVR
ncbi:hypothetical protein QYE76_037692 [Lolium multiflorum]|uniref:Uncharacterized protein n=1 Tax=Lolium multiflorum TaxID=4521 RepID=A0AAD8QIY7_LOLMU|nr:hypothetical protein QYE76_037692 [Lolium multiflorum]